MDEVAVYETKDIALATYVEMRAQRENLKVKLSKTIPNGQATRFFFRESEPGLWNRLEIDFVRSESSAFDKMMRTMKTLSHVKRHKHR